MSPIPSQCLEGIVQWQLNVFAKLHHPHNFRCFVLHHDTIRSDRKSVSYRRVKLSSGNLINEQQLGISIVRAFLHKTSRTSTFRISLLGTASAMFIDAISLLVFLLPSNTHSLYLSSLDSWSFSFSCCSRFVCSLALHPLAQFLVFCFEGIIGRRNIALLN